MSQRRSERPTPGRALSRATPGRGSRRTPSGGHAAPDATWLLFGDKGTFPADPLVPVQHLEPPASDLNRLSQEERLPSDGKKTWAQTQPLAQTPSAAPAGGEWMRAAQALSLWLQARLQRGTANALEQEAIARMWTAFNLGGVSEAQILKVAHLVQRAHAAIRKTPRGNTDIQSAYQAAAGVLHKALPAALKQRMPLERVALVIRRLRDEADPWTAIVGGASDLLGWNDFARFHAAATLRALITHYRGP